MAQDHPNSFFSRHEFVIRRLHSLTGLVPVGAYMVVHLIANASVNDGVNTFQRAVYQIHSLGVVLPLVEWAFIFLPILFHGILGVAIIREGLPNTGAYPFGSNVRFTLQRATGLIAFAFIAWHVFHMHGWIHADWWIDNVAEPYFGAQFKPYRAGSSLGLAMQPLWVKLLYAIGLLACVFHLANGMWTMGITWGAWVSPAAQRRALIGCSGFGVVLAIVGLGALKGASDLSREMSNDKSAAEIRALEDGMYESNLESGFITENEQTLHKRGHLEDEGHHEEESSHLSENSNTDEHP